MKEANKSNITLKNKLNVKPLTFKAECKTSLPSENVKKVIFLSANPYLTSVENTDSGVKFNGKVNFFICYENNDGEIKKQECINDFENVIKLEDNENCNATVDLKIEKTECDLSSLSVLVIATIEASVNVNKKWEYTFISGGEDFFSETEELAYLKSLETKSAVYSVEEEFELPYALLEVLSQKAVATISSCRCGVGSIIVDGEVNIYQILLQSEGKRDIIKESRVFPFSAEIECDEAMPNDFAIASVIEKSFKTDVSSDAEQNKSVVNCSIMLSLTGEVFALEEITSVKDAFSLDNELELIKENTSCVKNKEQFTITEKISGKTEFDELPVGSTLCLTTNEKVEVANIKIEEKGILVSGSISGTSLFRDGNGKYFSKKMETPFETLLPVSIKECCHYEVLPKAKSVENKIISLVAGELTIEACFTITCTETSNLTLLKEVKPLLEKKACDHAISVYIPLAGETLFPLAKRLNVNPNELLLTNKELNFPLSGEERIVIYRQR